MKRVLIADCRPLVRLGVIRALAGRRDLVCSECADGEATLASIAKLNPTLIILDFPPHNISGFDLISRIAKQHPRTRMLVFSNLDERLYGERALRAGAKGFLMKTASMAQFLKAVDCVLADEPFLAEPVMARVMQRYASPTVPVLHHPLELLSDRELEVFELLSQSLSIREISIRLRVGIKTVQSHRDNARTKLGLSSAAAMQRFAIEWSLIGNGGQAVSDGPARRRRASRRSPRPGTSRRS